MSYSRAGDSRILYLVVAERHTYVVKMYSNEDAADVLRLYIRFIGGIREERGMPKHFFLPNIRPIDKKIVPQNDNKGKRIEVEHFLYVVDGLILFNATSGI